MSFRFQPSDSRRRLLCALVLSFGLAGCQETADQAPNAERSEGSTSATSAEADHTDSRNAEAVNVEVRSWEKVQEWVSSQQGKVVVLDIWSTYCAPCIAEFPHFVELHNRLGDNVACASLSVDFYGGGETPEEIRPRVLKLLNEQRATTTNFICSTKDEDVLEAVGVASIPVVLVYDRQGKLHTTFNSDDAKWSDGFNYNDHITPLVDTLVE